MPVWLQILLGSGSLFMGLFLMFFGRYLMRRDKREEDEQHTSHLILKGIRKIGQLSYASALCASGQKPNGELHDAMEGYGEYMDELNEHIDKKASK